MALIEIKRSAHIERNYRYNLHRAWWDGDSSVTWIMLNPSTADADVDDLTVTKCMRYSRLWGFAGMEIVNLFALRSTDPSALLRNTDPIGVKNDWHIHLAVDGCREVIFAWGSHDAAINRLIDSRVPIVEKIILDHNPATEVSCLGRTMHGYPRHPSRTSYEVAREPYMLRRK
jgi:hypothetical protein